MAVRIVRLGTDRVPNEGLRIGTVRRPPRGVPKSEFSSGNWFMIALGFPTQGEGDAGFTARDGAEAP